MNLEEVKKVGAIAPNSIVNADCLEAMKYIADKSIDCIIADLPFGITNCHWDSVIPFEPLWEQYKRIIKPNGAIVLFGSQPFTSALVMSNPKWFKYEWIWDKVQPSGQLTARHMPMKLHENICVFYANKPTYNRQFTKRALGDIRINAIKNKGNQKNQISYAHIGNLPHKYSDDYDHSLVNPKTIIRISKQPNRKAFLHPTQKPVELLEYLIKTYSIEGELILDNTAGSGSLAIAAINTNRNYICIEKDDHYFEVMKERIANHDPNAPVKKPKSKRVPKGQLELF